ncbi:MAG: ATP-binding protein [Ignavibacteriales bacterium]|nr:ATP-binding protein [Ignavibacteriales bacterium]
MYFFQILIVRKWFISKREQRKDFEIVELHKKEIVSNKIQILSESLANKIAAGEVVQRPESAVKELIENAIDAEATMIEVMIKRAGKVLIQVCDDGVGMIRRRCSCYCIQKTRNK